MGCAGIAAKIVRAINLSSNSKLAAVASRSIEKARDFIVANNIADTISVYDSYEALLQDSSTDAIYVPLPTSLHLEWAVKVADSGKHLLLEKPAALSAAELEQIVQACNKNKVLFMDGVMFMHHERTARIRQALTDPSMGAIRRVDTSFSFLGSKEFLETNIRTSPQGDPLGALGDLGWYCIRLGLIIFSKGCDLDGNIKMPQSCTAVCNKWINEVVPLECEGTIKFGEDEFQHFNCSFLLPFRQNFEVCIVGNRLENQGDRVITCDDYVLPYVTTEASFDIMIFPPPEKHPHIRKGEIEHIFLPECKEHEINMIEQFARIAASLDKRKAEISSEQTINAEPDTLQKECEYWQKISLATQVIMDACMNSMKQGGLTIDLGFLLPPTPPENA